MERRTLRAAYKFYTGKVLEGAHDAMVDIEATYEVLLKQIDQYEGKNYHCEDEDCLTPITNDMVTLAEFSRRGRFVDFAGRIVYNDDNVEIFNFGKHKGKKVADVFSHEPSYFNWMILSSATLTPVVSRSKRTSGFSRFNFIIRIII